jgi:DNA invertase Pin-like site-specific DNA recombinase
MTVYVPIDDRPDQSSVRALILARTSDEGGQKVEVESQVAQCLKFIGAMGWRLIHPDDPSAYTETKTGMRQVRRPVLDAVLEMAQRKEVDVIVCLNGARIDREKGRRYYAIQTAKYFGVEFRFAKYADDRGHPPKGAVGTLQEAVDDIVDEQEAKTITDRLSPGKLARYEQGLPHGGRYGPLYGYRPGERRIRNTKPMGLLTWEIDEAKAKHIQWLFDAADTRDIADLTLRGLAREMEARAPTATGTSHWSTKQIWDLLRNGKYAGRGQNMRYEVEWYKKENEETGRIEDAHRTRERAAGTFPISPAAIPPLISAEQFDRVQDKLSKLRDQHNRGGPRRSDAAAHSTLLDGGFVRCAHCKSMMTRYWDSRSQYPFYKCIRRAGTPFHECKPHSIPAWGVDALALRLLAKVLTDPEEILKLADAAEASYSAATTQAELSTAHLDAIDTHLAKIATQREGYRTALSALGKIPGAEAMAAEIQENLARLDEEARAAEAERGSVTPRREIALQRQEFLRSLFMVRDRLHSGFYFPKSFSEPPPPNPYVGEPHLHIGKTISVEKAAELLGVPEEEVPGQRDGGWLNEDSAHPEKAVHLVDVETREVVYSLLRRAKPENLHRLLRELDVTVLVSRPRTREEWRQLGDTPISQRVALKIGLVEVRIDSGNVSALL